MPVSFYLIFATLLPLAGFVLLVFFGRRIAGLAGPLATVLVLGSLGLSVTASAVWVAKPEFNLPHYVEAATYRWLPVPAERVMDGSGPLRFSGDTTMAPLTEAGSQAISIGYCIDSLTVAMFVMVTLIAALVHLYSIAYMAGDERFPRYFAYLGLFTFSMLGLVLANSLVQMLVCWGIVGLASQLLTGFWFERRGPAMASLKAAVVHHAGDAAFLLGIAVLLLHVGAGGLIFYDGQGVGVLAKSVGRFLPEGSLVFLNLLGGGPNAFLGMHWLTWAGLLIFGGAMAKSAQFPLHVWLPDAMEGPTPASALVHGSAMVGAGVYLVARMYPILTMDTRLVIAVLGCVTLLMGALIAVVQTDIKRVLAYTAMSQVGYMMLFMGTGSYTTGVLHLFTHAFFMACLFLAAGSVIIALKGQQDLRQMGGLWRKLPLTAVAFGIATAAVIGVPFFSGGYSRGLGLAGVYEYAHMLATPKQTRAAMLLFYLPASTTFITAFGMARCWWLTFGGKHRNEDLFEQAQEYFLMTMPTGILAALCFNFYGFFHFPSVIIKSLPGVGGDGPPIIRIDHTLDHARQLLMMRGGAFAFWGFLGAIPAIGLYYRGLGYADRLRRTPVLNLLHAWLRERMYFDVLYNGLLVNVFLIAAKIAAFVDRYVIDGLARLAGVLVRMVSRLGARIDEQVIDGAAKSVGGLARLGGKAALAPQRGRVRLYLMVMVAALVATGGVLVLMAVAAP